MRIFLPFNRITGECPIVFKGATGERYRLWKIVPGGVFPGTYTLSVYSALMKPGDTPVREYTRMTYSQCEKVLSEELRMGKARLL